MQIHRPTPNGTGTTPKENHLSFTQNVTHKQYLKRFSVMSYTRFQQTGVL